MMLLTLKPPHAAVPRHQARVIKLQYCGEGPIQKTLMLVGKVRGDAQTCPENRTSK